MNVTDALKSRISTRAFLSKEVDESVVLELLDAARWSPSGGNLQPWKVHVVTGEAKERLIKQVRQAIAENPMGSSAELAIYPPQLEEPWRTRRFKVGEQLYESLNIPREDKLSRLAQLAKNYEFFGAPIGMFFSIDRSFDKNQWAHLGMFMQSLALVATERGLATCMQEAWCMHAGLVSKFLELPDNEQLYCGMALGYSDESAPINQIRSHREHVEGFCKILRA